MGGLQMKHNHFFQFLWKYRCAVCKVRQLQRGFKLDRLGYQQELRSVRYGLIWTQEEKNWILRQVGELD